MVARFFVDENDLALGKALAALHGDVVYPGHPELPEVPRQTEDDVWLEVVGRRRLVVITRDKKIRYRPVERQVWVTHPVRGFVLTGRSSQTTAHSLAILQTHWNSINNMVISNPDGPWMFAPRCRSRMSPDIAPQRDYALPNWRTSLPHFAGTGRRSPKDRPGLSPASIRPDGRVDNS